MARFLNSWDLKPDVPVEGTTMGDQENRVSVADEWFADLPTSEVTDTDFVPDIPLELLPVIQAGERIWPRVFPGL